jgi:hypothetical protein
MLEHRIRFRGGWESNRSGGEVARLNLPIVWPSDSSGTIRLTRRFGRPPLDPEAETAWLELGFVSGLRSAWLNEGDLDLPDTHAASRRVSLGSRLEDRNVLTLEVDLGLVDPGEASAGWGWIALVIGPIEPVADPTESGGGVESSPEMP